MSKTLRLVQITVEHQDCPFFYRISSHKNFFPKYLDNAFRFRLNFTNIEAAIVGKSSGKRFWKNSSQCREILQQVK